MREIKFRAWHEASKIMFENGFNLNLDGEFIEHEKEGVFYFKGNNMVQLLQFTGQKDKNGRKIFEGDFCTSVEFEDTGEIIFSNAGFSLNWMPLDVYKNSDIEVLGNIYENPELLK